MIRILIGILLYVSIQATPVMAGTDPISLAKDSRIRTVPYDKNDVVQILAHYGFTITIEFSPSEVILSEILGDSAGWQMVPVGNRLVLKPQLPDNTTNMTVLTSLRSYNYELITKNTNNPRDKKLTYYLRYTYPEEENRKAMDRYRKLTDIEKANREKEKTQVEEPNRDVATNLNFDYVTTQRNVITPTQVFDDGKFTYFQFPEENPLPAIFVVDQHRNEALVNYRIEKSYVVVEQLSDRFTLRNGELITTVLQGKPTATEEIKDIKKQATTSVSIFNQALSDNDW